MTGDRVVSLRKDVVETAIEALRNEEESEALGCAVISIDKEGNYTYSACGMSAEEMLAGAEILKAAAMNALMGGEE